MKWMAWKSHSIVMSDLEAIASDLADTLEDNDIEPDEDDIHTRLDSMVNEYSVPEPEAKRSVLRHYADLHDVELDGIGGGSDSGGTTEVSVEDIDTDDQWVTVEVQVVQLWDSDSDSVKQTGLVADETGRIKFTAWSESDLDLLEDGASYRLENVVTDSWEGRMSIQLNSTTEITPLEEEVEAVEQDTESRYGAVVAVQSGSGLIKRCPVDDCTRVLNNSRCNEHGNVEGEFDLRIKAVLDDGTSVQDVLFDADATEELTGIGLEAAKEQAQQALDTTVVAQNIEEQIVGRYYAVEGPIVGRYLLANEFQSLPDPDMSDIRERLEGMTA